MPCRQYIIDLDAGAKPTASDGASRVIAADEMVLVEDIDGQGQLSQSGGGQLRRSIFVPIDDAG